MGEMYRMNIKGDTKVQWDPTKPTEVEAAKKYFSDLTKQGYLAFKVTGVGNKGEQINEFDPQVKRIILAPPMAGG